MEIPAGKTCEGCAYLDWDNDDTVDIRTCTLFDGVWAEGYPQRCIECLSAYPNGATITITPKETP